MRQIRIARLAVALLSAVEAGPPAAAGPREPEIPTSDVTRFYGVYKQPAGIRRPRSSIATTWRPARPAWPRSGCWPGG